VLLHAMHGMPWRSPAGKALRVMIIEDGMVRSIAACLRRPRSQPRTARTGRAGEHRRASEPLASSVRGSLGRAGRLATPARSRLLSWADSGPVVTGVVRCGPVVRDPNVAPAWPSGHELGMRVPARQSYEMLRLLPRPGALTTRPLVTVRDRQSPLRQARGGHGRRGRTRLGRCRGVTT